MTGIDGIIVPTARAGKRLDHAASLAKALDCRLIGLCSGNASAHEAITATAAQYPNILTADVPPAVTERIFTFETSCITSAHFSRSSDLSAKRNIGLLVARYTGWQGILFLDDDIYVDDPDDIRSAAVILGEYPLVGLGMAGFTDGSVAAHAHLILGGQAQKVPSGAALAVATRRRQEFFADIYNEDLLYMLDGTGLSRIAITGTARQDAYDPFYDPARAVAEEFGEVFVIGLHCLARAGRPLQHADDEYWQAFLCTRDNALLDLLNRLPSSSSKPAEKERIAAALRSAREALAAITPEMCASYFRAWSRDRRRWALHLGQLPTGLPPQTALAELGLVPLSPDSA